MMGTIATLEMESQTVSDRDALRASLESTRTAFHRLLEPMTDTLWRSKSPVCEWTVGEVLVHLTWALEQLPKEVEMARQGKGMFNLPKWIANPGSYWLTRWEARNVDAESLRPRYDAAMDAAIAALETVPNSDWGLGARFYGEGFYTVAGLFATPAQHLAEHTRQG